jgi:hypothetical protein
MIGFALQRVPRSRAAQFAIASPDASSHNDTMMARANRAERQSGRAAWFSAIKPAGFGSASPDRLLHAGTSQVIADSADANTAQWSARPNFEIIAPAAYSPLFFWIDVA